MTTLINQLRINMLEMQAYQGVKNTRPTVENVVEEDKEKIFAQKGEDNYNEAMYFNGDGVVTYDEYIQYCEENAVSQYYLNPSVTFISTTTQDSNSNTVRPVHIGRALESYSLFGEEKIKPYVETEV